MTRRRPQQLRGQAATEYTVIVWLALAAALIAPQIVPSFFAALQGYVDLFFFTFNLSF